MPSPRTLRRRKIGKHFNVKWGERLGRPECPYLRRWGIQLGAFSIRVHHFIRSDDIRAFHDHSWWFVTCVLRGGYYDVSPEQIDHLGPGSIRFRPAKHQHTVLVDHDGYPNVNGCWTVILTGPNLHTWGFWEDGKFTKANKWFASRGHHPCDQL